MSTQTRLTLSSVLVMTAIVAIISILDLGYQMDAQYAATLEHAELLKRMASKAWCDTLNRDRQHPGARPCARPTWRRQLIDIMSASHAVLEIAVCDNNNEILIDSDPKAQGKKFPPIRTSADRGQHQLAGQGQDPQPASTISSNSRWAPRKSGALCAGGHLPAADQSAEISCPR
jgi:hypothetical protein